MTDTPTTLAPGEVLVLVTKRPTTHDELVHVRKQLPDAFRDRVLVVDGSSFDAYVIPAGAA